MERARAGDRRALRALYDDHVDRVYALAFRMTGDEELARDATQDAFLRAFQRLDQFRGEAAFGTWLHRIAASVVLNGIRKRNGAAKREVELEVEGLPAAAVEVGGAGFELRARLRKAVDALPEIYRTVFLMYDVEGFTHPEIAEALEVAEGTSKARLSRARERLRRELKDIWRDEWTTSA